MSSPGSIEAAERPNALAADVLVDRGEDGIWRYSGTTVAAVGAQDRTLADVVQVRQLGTPGERPEAVMLSLPEIIADPRLNWVLQAGTRLRGGDEDLFSVPWAVWEERAAEPVDVWLPERDAEGLGRRLAIAEREVRFIREALEASTARRSQLTVLATKLGMTRRQISEMLGLSVGRVQQLHEEATREQDAFVQQTIHDARLLLAHAEDSLQPATIGMPSGWSQEKLEDVVAQLIDVGLLEDTEDESGAVRITAAGRSLRADLASAKSESPSAGHKASSRA
jgi:hypothetical protein